MCVRRGPVDSVSAMNSRCRVVGTLKTTTIEIFDAIKNKNAAVLALLCTEQMHKYSFATNRES